MKRYPLEALRSVRENAVAEQQQRLAACVAAVSEAGQQLRAREQQLKLERDSLAEEQQRELRRVAVGVARASDFQRAAEYRVTCEQRISAMLIKVNEARQALGAAEQNRAAAEQQLGDVKAAAKLIDRHKEKFTETDQVRQEAELEEVGVEAWAAAQGQRERSERRQP